MINVCTSYGRARLVTRWLTHDFRSFFFFFFSVGQNSPRVCTWSESTFKTEHGTAFFPETTQYLLPFDRIGTVLRSNRDSTRRPHTPKTNTSCVNRCWLMNGRKIGGGMIAEEDEFQTKRGANDEKYAKSSF